MKITHQIVFPQSVTKIIDAVSNVNPITTARARKNEKAELSDKLNKDLIAIRVAGLIVEEKLIAGEYVGDIASERVNADFVLYRRIVREAL